MNKNKKIAWLSTTLGAITSILGILGAVCATPICGTICASGLLTILTGVGVIAFLHKYHLIFLLIGLSIFICGVILIIKCKKKSVCSHDEN